MLFPNDLALSKGPTKLRTLNQLHGKLKRLVDIFGDVPVSSIKKTDAREYRIELMKLPSNINKKKEYRDLDVSTILNEINAGQLSIPDQDVLSPSTVKSYIECASTLFKSLFEDEIINRNPFEGVSGINKDEFMKDSEYRDIWAPDQLKTIFSGSQYTQLEMYHPFYYWVPLIALYSGARLNEICQLYCDDIVEQDSILLFSISKERSDQTLKNKHAKRFIPVHSKLIELGFKSYLRDIRDRGEERLFPELTLSDQGYGKMASSWFARYREKHDLKVEDKMQDFHSFRHNVADFFKQHELPEVAAAAILGHSDQGITYGRYGKDLQVRKLVEIIEKLDFSDVVSSVLHWDSKTQ
jgi:integrase